MSHIYPNFPTDIQMEKRELRVSLYSVFQYNTSIKSNEIFYTLTPNNSSSLHLLDSYKSRTTLHNFSGRKHQVKMFIS